MTDILGHWEVAYWAAVSIACVGILLHQLWTGRQANIDDDPMPKWLRAHYRRRR